MTHAMDSFFNPAAVAFLGSTKPGKIGYEMLKSMQQGGYAGRIHPVNPGGGEVLGLPVVTDLEQLPGPVELAVISVPQRAVIDSVIRCGRKGIPAAVVISSGFSEVGNREDEARLTAAARDHGVRLVGPNCAGLMNPWHNHFPSIEVRALRGYTAFVTQSGALGGATLALAEARGFGFSKFVSYGNRCDVGDIELLEYLADDPQTRVIALYMEGMADGRAFLRSAQAASRKKPIIAIKSGRTAAGTRAASSHTGSLAGDDQIYDAAFRKAGIIRVEGIEEMFDLCQALALCPPPAGNRVAIVTNSGGPGILCADMCERLGLDVSPPSEAVRAVIRPHVSAHASLNNPVDLTVEGEYEEYRRALEGVLVEYDAAIVINVATPYLDSTGIARGTIEAAAAVAKPVLVNFMAGRIVAEAVETLREAGMVCLTTGERCAQALAKLTQRTRLLERLDRAPLD